MTDVNKPQITNSSLAEQSEDSPLIDQFKALYYLIKGKRDTDIKLFDDNKLFTKSDVINLNTKINEKLNLHNVVTAITTISFSFSNKEIKSYGTWNEFLNEKFELSGQTEIVIIEWDFNLTLPNQKHNVPQTHTMRVRIGGELRPNEVLSLMFEGGKEFELEQHTAQMACKIDFVNLIICNELKLIVTSWYDALPKISQDDTLRKSLRKYNFHIEETIKFIILIASILFTYSFFKHISSQYIISTNNDLVLALLIVFSFLFLAINYAIKLGGKFADNATRKTTYEMEKAPIFNITSGDKNRAAEIESKNNSLYKQLKTKFFISLIIALVMWGLGNLIPYIIKLCMQ